MTKAEAITVLRMTPAKTYEKQSPVTDTRELGDVFRPIAEVLKRYNIAIKQVTFDESNRVSNIKVNGTRFYFEGVRAIKDRLETKVTKELRGLDSQLGFKNIEFSFLGFERKEAQFHFTY